MRNPQTFKEIDALAEAGVRGELDTFVLPKAIVATMERNGVNPLEIEAIVGPRDALGAGDLLTPEQSERAARLAHIVSLAQQVFGADETAFLWLRAPNAQLGGKTPLECVTRESGARFVEETLIRIDHGIAA